MSPYLSIIGWAFLPGLAASWIQTIYYGITIRAGDPKPAAGSARHNSHRRVIQFIVIASYLLYTIYEADYDLRTKSSYYTDLSVPFTAQDREIKSRFRRLAAVHHPDKSGASASADTANYFMHLKQASDTLTDAARRFAYDRFGPEINDWQKCVTVKDYIFRGVLSGVLPHYVIAAVSIYILGLFGYLEFGKYYRWLIIMVLCVFELSTTMRPDFPPIVTGINAIFTTVTTHPPFLPFQVISLARKFIITSYIALSHLGPLISSEANNSDKKAESEEKALSQNLDRLEAFAKNLDSDVVRLMEMELAPYRGDAEASSNLQGKMKEWLVQNTIRADPMVRDSMGTSLRKRRIDAPVGAKGNR